jgi:hypothetical protein
MVARSRLGLTLLCLVVAPLLLAGCSKPKTQYPPRVDLARFGTLGMIDFSSPAAEGLGSLASREFLASLQSAQPGTAVLELGDEKRALASLGRDTLDLEAIRTIGEKYRVDALIVGVLQAENMQPNISFDSALSWMTASAELESGLNVRILDSNSGATLWSTAERARAEIARVDVDGSGVSGIGANPTDDARLRLVRRLAQRATRDFWPYWQ